MEKGNSTVSVVNCKFCRVSVAQKCVNERFQTVQFNFSRPVTLSITSDLSFEANFVLATLTEVEDDSVTDKGQASTKVGSHKMYAFFFFFFFS